VRFTTDSSAHDGHLQTRMQRPLISLNIVKGENMKITSLLNDNTHTVG
jgi:hypothetical protein